MPPNLKKSGSNSSQTSAASEGFSAPRKPSENAATQRGLNFTAERELGSAGGIKATGKLTVGVDSLLGQQGVTIEADAVNKTLGVGVNVGSARGKLGVNIGGKVGYDEQGKISIRGAEAAVNIGGFGGSASIDDEKGIGGSISVAGAKIEITVSPDGKKTLSLCYGVPGGELCTTFEPDPGITAPIQPPPIIPMPPPNPTVPNQVELPDVDIMGWVPFTEKIDQYSYGVLMRTIIQNRTATETDTPQTFPNPLPYTSVNTSTHPNAFWEAPLVPKGAYLRSMFLSTFRRDGGPNISHPVLIYYANAFAWSRVCFPGTARNIKKFINDYNSEMQKHKNASSLVSGNIIELIPTGFIPFEEVPVITAIDVPNYPQTLKPMDCCEEIKEIHRFLGIGKFKKKKFAIANQFLAPGATGNTECADYYELEEAKIRMMANGLILNPVSSPNSTPWQTVNATAWAAQMYEMMAESMSDGNQSQKVEIALMMQLSQMMKVIAEMKREIEFLSQCIGITPELDTEDLPICFTIFQGHKGFGKKDKKLIDITSQKTDAQVEMTLTEMLQPSKIPITVRRFKPDSISIIEALRQI